VYDERAVSEGQGDVVVLPEHGDCQAHVAEYKQQSDFEHPLFMLQHYHLVCIEKPAQGVYQLQENGKSRELELLVLDVAEVADIGDEDANADVVDEANGKHPGAVVVLVGVVVV